MTRTPSRPDRIVRGWDCLYLKVYFEDSATQGKSGLAKTEVKDQVKVSRRQRSKIKCSGAIRASAQRG